MDSQPAFEMNEPELGTMQKRYPGGVTGTRKDITKLDDRPYVLGEGRKADADVPKPDRTIAM